MTRKLFSTLLSAFALLLLMGAAAVPQQQSAVMLAEEESTASQETVLETETQPMIESNEAGANEVPADPETESDATTENKVPDPVVVNTDDKLLIDGVPAPLDLCKTQIEGVTYVALAPMAKLLDPTAQIVWNGASGSAAVTTAKLTLVAQKGVHYIEANGRFLYLPETIRIVNGRTMLPLTAIAEAFGASVKWDGATGVITVTRGSGAIMPGDQFYNKEDLFWLSRIIYAESGNQSLQGKMAVGNVVMNRVANPIYPNTVKGVLAQKNQFSTYKGGKLANRTPNASSVLAAKLVLDGGVAEGAEDALYFDSGRNSWAAKHRDCVAVIGGHRFYN